MEALIIILALLALLCLIGAVIAWKLQERDHEWLVGVLTRQRNLERDKHDYWFSVACAESKKNIDLKREVNKYKREKDPKTGKFIKEACNER